VFVNVLNRSRAQDLVTTIESQSGAMAGVVDVWELNHPDLKATHTFGDDMKVRPVRRQIPAGSGPQLRYVFPAHSLTILTFTLQ
jgi:alpha-L-arabinofuranosidase